MTVAEAVDRLPRRMATWVARRSLAPNSATGISLCLGLCAAVWFSAGTRSGNVIGAAALCGSYLAGHSARGLGVQGPVATVAAAASPGAVAGQDAVAGQGAAAGQDAAAISAGRLARACGVLTECGVYAGLAAGGLALRIPAVGRSAGGLAPGRIGMWQLATTVVILVSVSQLAGACGNLRSASGPREARLDGLILRALAFPYAGRVLLIVAVAPLWGGRAALFGLLGWAVIAICYALVGGRRQPAESAGLRPVADCRDDGLLAGWLGRPVRGQLVPLPPALTGLAAVCVLAALGLRDLPGFLLIAPVIAMLLAAVGSSHPHDGRLDWIVPVVLQVGQYVYIAAVGFATAVPAPVIFALCAVVAVRYEDLAGHAQRHAALGWDGRMIVAGLGAALGIATFAYLLLAAYVGVLICREARTSWLAAMEGDRR
jgi:hypothetical protein